MVERLLDALKHRGPDNSGKLVTRNAILAHTRLSILDLSTRANQPMTSGGCSIVFNGEIYNFRHLKQELENRGRKFVTDGDTEVILQAYQEYGERAFEKLEGMFAFALVDESSGAAYLVRDRIGIKPLVYMNEGSDLLFASELGGLEVLTQRTFNPDLSVFPEWCYYGSALRENTFVEGVKKLLPGHFLKYELRSKNQTLSSYWMPEKLPGYAGQRARNHCDLTGAIRSKLENAVEKQLVSDVPVGIFLSGGIDSSAITAFASKHYQGKLQTFSVGFDYDPAPSELEKARIVADHCGTEHHELYVSGYDLIDTLELLVKHHGSPFSDAANIPLYLLTKELTGDTKVILQGDGGDELFGGYRRYTTLSHFGLLRTVLPVLKLVNWGMPRTQAYYARKRYIDALSMPEQSEVMALLLTAESLALDPRRIFSAKIQEAISNADPFTAFRDCAARFSEADILQKMLLTDTQIILPDIFLEKVDIATMANGIEVRVPFLDEELVDFALQIPGSSKVRYGQAKHLLKKALKGVLPQSILSAPKQGFGVPYKYWITGVLREYFESMLSQHTSRKDCILDGNYVSSLLKEHIAGEKDNGFMLWKVLNLLIWYSLYQRDAVA